MTVIKKLSELGIDLIEISGGNYESPNFVGKNLQLAQGSREAYFLDFAEKAKELTDTPIAVTGGFRSARGMQLALENGVEMVGLACSMAVDPDLPNRILQGEPYESPVRPIQTGIKVIDRIALLEVTWYEQQIERISKGKPTKPHYPPLLSLLQTIWKSGGQVFQKRRAASEKRLQGLKCPSHFEVKRGIYIYRLTSATPVA